MAAAAMTTRAMPSPPASHADGHSSSASDSESDMVQRSSRGPAHDDAASSSSSSSSSSSGRASAASTHTPIPAAAAIMHRGRSATLRRADNGSIIVSSDAPVEARDEIYPPEDARTMSPRRSGEEVNRLGENARQALIQQAKELQESLLEIVDRVESVREEHEKLEGGNRFLQSYIGELMQTSKLTATGTGKGKSRGKAAK